MTFLIPSSCCVGVFFSRVRYKRIDIDDCFVMVSLSGACTAQRSKGVCECMV
jgi:hypothetical protein